MAKNLENIWPLHFLARIICVTNQVQSALTRQANLLLFLGFERL